MKTGRPARHTPHDGASGVRKVIGRLGRSLAESPEGKRPEKESEVIVVYRWVLAVGPMVLKLGRRSEFSCLGFLSRVLLPRPKATNTRTISFVIH